MWLTVFTFSTTFLSVLEERARGRCFSTSQAWSGSLGAAGSQWRVVCILFKLAQVSHLALTEIPIRVRKKKMEHDSWLTSKDFLSTQTQKHTQNGGATALKRCFSRSLTLFVTHWACSATKLSEAAQCVLCGNDQWQAFYNTVNLGEQTVPDRGVMLTITKHKYWFSHMLNDSLQKYIYKQQHNK